MNSLNLLQVAFNWDKRALAAHLAMLDKTDHGNVTQEILEGFGDSPLGGDVRHHYREARQALGLDEAPAKRPAPTILASRKHHFHSSDVPLE